MPHKSKVLSERKIAIVEGYLRGEMEATQIVNELLKWDIWIPPDAA